jgi:hypothetical protein
VLLGLLGANSATSTSQTVPRPDYAHDVRLLKIKRFFSDRQAPAEARAEDFLMAADRHGLDWRLLPSVAFVESSGGKYFRNNNILGWDNGRQNFPTVAAGIHHVARRLADSPLYRGKTLDEKLNVYNRNHAYARRVKRLMNQLSLVSEHRPVRR